MGNQRFDAEYYARFYADPTTRVTGQAEIARLVEFVCAYVRYLELPVRRVLDMGCGLGLWRTPLLERFPAARYHGVEVSEHLCEKLGWEHGQAQSYRGRGRFDLIVCQGVLQYLDRPAADAAIDNLARLSRGVLYLEALTREDWQHNCDQDRTDGDVHLRSAAWYRKRLRVHFQPLGGGLFLRRDAGVTLYELEKP